VVVVLYQALPSLTNNTPPSSPDHSTQHSNPSSSNGGGGGGGRSSVVVDRASIDERRHSTMKKLEAMSHNPTLKSAIANAFKGFTQNIRQDGEGRRGKE